MGIAMLEIDVTTPHEFGDDRIVYFGALLDLD